eukprot:1147342-Pelagomonas_calceolata.AAC.5
MGQHDLNTMFACHQVPPYLVITGQLSCIDEGVAGNVGAHTLPQARHTLFPVRAQNKYQARGQAKDQVLHPCPGAQTKKGSSQASSQGSRYTPSSLCIRPPRTPSSLCTHTHTLFSANNTKQGPGQDAAHHWNSALDACKLNFVPFNEQACERACVQCCMLCICI